MRSSTCRVAASTRVSPSARAGDNPPASRPSVAWARPSASASPASPSSWASSAGTYARERRAARSTSSAVNSAWVAELTRSATLSSPTDVTDEQAVGNLAARAVERFGRIDIWINNAGVMLVGAFIDTPAEDYRRVIEINFFGEVHGARAALPIFRGQGEGTLVNIASLDARAPQPHASAYIASKHAVRALGMSLRQELMLDGYDHVHVVTILPATIDTPIFQHAANYTNRRIVAPPPVYPADEVVRAVYEAIRDPKSEIYAGRAARAGSLAMKLLPGATDSEFHANEGMGDTVFGDDSWKNDRTEVAGQGIEALFAGDDHVVGGDEATKQQVVDHRSMSEPEKAARQGAMARPQR